MSESNNINGKGSIELVFEHKKGAKWTDESLAAYLSVQSPALKVISPFVNTKTKIKCTCSDCGNTWETIPGNLIKGTGCPKCATNRTKRMLKKSQDQFESEMAQKNPQFKLVGKYINYHTPVEIQCVRCNEIIKKRPDRILNGEVCPKCSFPTKKGKQVFVEELKAVNADIEVIGEYKTSRDYIECKCLKCGAVWMGVPHQLLSGVGCPGCNLKNQTSYTEKYIFYFLHNNLKTEVISRTTDGIGKELDIYLPTERKAIEFGSWHWHKHRIENDMDKMKCCRNLGIDLLVIYDGYKGKCFEEKNVLTFEHVFSKQNVGEIKELCIKINDHFGFDIDINNVDWKAIDKSVNKIIKKIDTREILSRINSKEKGFVILDDFSNIHDKVKCQCLICNYVWESTITNLMYNGRGCKLCYAKNGHKYKTKQIRLLDLEGNLLKTYSSISAASKETGIPTSKICCVCKETRKTAGGYRWEYADE